MGGAGWEGHSGRGRLGGAGWEGHSGRGRLGGGQAKTIIFNISLKACN